MSDERVVKERVTIDVDGTRVVGDIHRPASSPAGARLPAIVFAGPMTSVKEQVTGTYAAAFAERGYVTLALDHRHFGESGGVPRQYEHHERKTRDLAVAVEALAARSDIDPADLSIVGICLGAAYAVAAARVCPVARLGLIVGYYRDPAEMRARDEAGFARRVAEGRKARELYETTGEVVMIPAAAREGDAAMQSEDTVDYYTRRRAVPSYVNAFATMSREVFVPFDVQALAPEVVVPVAMVHSQAALSPSWAISFHDRLSAPKSLEWLPSRTHTEFYDDPGLVNLATTHILSAWRTLPLRRE